MLKDISEIREAARIRAERRWNNHAVEKAFRATQKEKLGAPKEPEDPKIGEMIKNEELRKGAIYRAQTKFAKEIRTMLENHTQRNLEQYRRTLLAKIYRLKREKLRHLQAKNSDITPSKQDQKKDLFT
jgi:hypothetical protein